MPIIPRVDIPQGVPTLPQQAPGIEAFPAYNQSRLGAQVAQSGLALADLGAAVMQARNRQDAIDGIFKAETLKSEAAIALEGAMEDAQTRPQETIAGVAPTGADNGGTGLVEEPVATTTLIPRSQTLLPDYEKSQEAILKNIEAKAQGNPHVLRRLAPALERLKTTATARMMRAGLALQKQETAATINENVDLLVKSLRVKDPVPATADENGVINIKLADDRSYQSARAGVSQAIDLAAREGGLDPKTAEQMKSNRLAKMDAGRALKTMIADPESWLAASGSGTNEWQGQLTDEAMVRLDRQAKDLDDRRTGSANQARLELERKTMSENFERAKIGAANPLTEDDITQQVKDQKIDYDKGKELTQLVRGLKAGEWPDDPYLVVRMRLESGNFNVTNAFEARVNAMVRPGGLSLKTASDLKNTARAIIQKRDDVAQAQDFKIAALQQTAMNTMLTPPPFMGPAIDHTARSVQADAQQALLDNGLKNGFGTSAKWWKENQHLFVGQLSDRVNSMVKIFNKSLPTPLPVDPKTDLILPETIADATVKAFERAKITPEEAAALRKAKKPLPAGLMQELKTLEDLELWTGYQAEARSKRPKETQ